MVVAADLDAENADSAALSLQPLVTNNMVIA
jgi:hypothetical protein